MTTSDQGASWTRKDLLRMHFAMPADEWIIRVVPVQPSGRVKSEKYTWRVFANIETVKFYRAQNAQDHHIFGRPNSTRYVLIDDINLDTVDKMKKDGLEPVVVLETSSLNGIPNLQAWVALSKEELPTKIASQAARLLAIRYKGDMGSTDAFHLGRLPGLRNRKLKYIDKNGGYPIVRFRMYKNEPLIPRCASMLIDEAREIDSRILTSSTKGGCELNSSNINIDNFDPLSYNMTPDDAIGIYEETANTLIKKLGSEYINDRSRMDYNIARHLFYKQFEFDEVVNVILYGSEKARERGLDYVLMSVSKATNKL
ncbi:MAG: hypothetical protein HQL69_19770 [Magnetococcales bacterium]|nr:hypothetical protein [Magnetococcales bacterium]